MKEGSTTEKYDETRRVDWRTMSMKLYDAVNGLLANPNGKGEQEWAAQMMFRVREMRWNEDRIDG